MRDPSSFFFFFLNSHSFLLLFTENGNYRRSFPWVSICMGEFFVFTWVYLCKILVRFVLEVYKIHSFGYIELITFLKLVATNVIFVYRMFMDTPEDEKTKLISCLGAFRQFWGGLSQVSTAFLICSTDDFDPLPPFFFLHLFWCCYWGLSGKKEIKSFPSFFYSYFISFHSYSSGEPVLESQVGDRAVWDIF